MVVRVFLPGRSLLQTILFYAALVAITLRGLHPVDSPRFFLFLPLVLIYGFLLRVLSRPSQRPMPAITEGLGGMRAV